MYDILRSIVQFSSIRQKIYGPIRGVFLLSVLAGFLLVSCSDLVSNQETTSDSTDSNTSTGTTISSPEIPPTQEPASKATIVIDGPESDAPEEDPTAAVETSTPIPEDTPEPVDTPTAESTTAAGNGDIITEVNAVRNEIEDNVVEIRGLAPKESVEVTLLDRDELRQRLEEEMLADYSPDDAKDDAIVMSAFDFFSKDFDLYAFTLDLLTEEIAGFYDPETDEFVLINEDEEFDILEQLMHAHEFDHALQDQHFDLEQLDDDSLDSEASMALSALAEGDATLVQTIYLLEGYLTPDELLAVLSESLDIDTSILDEAPPVLARELMFPYLEGVAFVEALYMNGGFDAVDQAWQVPPQSTEHILHPQRYMDGDSPQIVSLAPLTDTLGAGWQLLDEDIVGELYLREYLIQQLEEQKVDIAATGWGGDQYAVYWNETDEDLVLVLRIAWDSPADNAEFMDVYREYPGGVLGSKSRKQPDGGQCWEGNEVICLYSFENETIITKASTLERATQVAAEQLEFMRLGDV